MGRRYFQGQYMVKKLRVRLNYARDFGGPTERIKYQPVLS